MRKHEEFSYLKTIIRDLLGVDVLEDKSRVQQVVNAKMIYAYILKEKGYGCSVIAKSMGMNHATVLHYFKTIPWYLTWNTKKKVDELLRMDCSMYCNLGSDSSKSDKGEVRVSSRKIYLGIKSIDESTGTLFLQTMDSNKNKT